MTESCYTCVLVSFTLIYTQIKTEAYIVNNVSHFLRYTTTDFLVFEISLTIAYQTSDEISTEKYFSPVSLCITIAYYSVIIDGKNVRIDRMRIRKGRAKEDLFKMMNTKLQPYRLYAAIIQINVASPKFYIAKFYLHIIYERIQ